MNLSDTLQSFPILGFIALMTVPVVHGCESLHLKDGSFTDAVTVPVKVAVHGKSTPDKGRLAGIPQRQAAISGMLAEDTFFGQWRCSSRIHDGREDPDGLQRTGEHPGGLDVGFIDSFIG